MLAAVALAACCPTEAKPPAIVGRYCLRAIDGRVLPTRIERGSDSATVIAGALGVYDHGEWEWATYFQLGDVLRVDNEGGFWYDGDFAHAFRPAGTDAAYL
jgi:hypothetical protein